MDNHPQIPKRPYRGRFAPSPTGPLHFGSMVAAVGSYLQARHLSGQWLVRIEDLDPPREQPGASKAILDTLNAYEMDWDASVEYQSQRAAYYEDALQTLARAGHSYPCSCSRKDLQQFASTIYPGTCRNGLPKGTSARATRVYVPQQVVHFLDAIQGDYSQQLAQDVGDFVIKRADGLFAYQLAVVVDDDQQDITEVVRGADLLDNTPRQIYLQTILGLDPIRYAHLPVATNALGEKLSKQTRARPVDISNPAATLLKILDFLGQHVTDDLTGAPLKEIWPWAIDHWNIEHVPKSCSTTQV